MLKYQPSFTIFIFMISLCQQCYADFPRPWQMTFQEPATPVMERIVVLHHYILIIITLIACLVGGLLIYSMWRFRAKKNPVPSIRSHHIALEITWTAIPAIILAIIAYPSLRLLYYMDKAQEAPITLKITGHQWYWEYEYIDKDPTQNINFNSYMLPAEKLKPSDLRQLAVDEEVVVPVRTNVRILLTSADVLHSWAVPSFGVKHDTVPGRLSETWINVNKPGKYYGQCSELCGSGHGFMSIVVRAVPMAAYQLWLNSKKAPPATKATASLMGPQSRIDHENKSVKPELDKNQPQTIAPASQQPLQVSTPVKLPVDTTSHVVNQSASAKKNEVPTSNGSPQLEKKSLDKVR